MSNHSGYIGVVPFQISNPYGLRLYGFSLVVASLAAALDHTLGGEHQERAARGARVAGGF